MPRVDTQLDHSERRRAVSLGLADAIVAVLETMAGPLASEPDHLLCPEDAATALDISRATVYKLIRSGALGSMLIGGRRKISRADLDDYIAAQRHGGPR